MKRYEALAAEIEASIRHGTLKPGDKLPSVRQASKTRQVSPSTVFEAYYLLEARGLVRARPQSGYYVAATAKALPSEPRLMSSPDGESRPVAVSELVFEILGSAASRSVVPLGSAFPSPALFPLARLGRATANSATHLDPWSTVDDLTQGNAGLRQQIALRYLLDGVQLSPDEIGGHQWRDGSSQRVPRHGVPARRCGRDRIAVFLHVSAGVGTVGPACHRSGDRSA